jgi:hypothetical protein
MVKESLTKNAVFYMADTLTIHVAGFNLTRWVIPPAESPFMWVIK